MIAHLQMSLPAYYVSAVFQTLHLSIMMYLRKMMISICICHENWEKAEVWPLVHTCVELNQRVNCSSLCLSVLRNKAQNHFVHDLKERINLPHHTHSQHCQSAFWALNFIGWVICGSCSHSLKLFHSSKLWLLRFFLDNLSQLIISCSLYGRNIKLKHLISIIWCLYHSHMTNQPFLLLHVCSIYFQQRYTVGVGSLFRVLRFSLVIIFECIFLGIIHQTLI